MSEFTTTLLEAMALKDEPRAGWVLRAIEDPESVADHSWGVSLLCLLFADRADAEIDLGRALAMAVVHDLAEAWTGDVPKRAAADAASPSADEKAARERAVMRDLDRLFPAAGLLPLWEEYVRRETPEAAFVKDMDLLDNCLQAAKYEDDGRYDKTAANEHFVEYDELDEFFATAEPRLRTELGRELFETFERRYERAKNG